MSDNLDGKKVLIFVSPGRCGTTRIAEILKEKLPAEDFAVTHQMPFSRLANVVGNLMYYFGQSEKIKEKLYNFIVSRYTNGKNFITTDPLTAMIIPQKLVKSKNVCIVQITREPEEFAESFYRFSRKRMKSFIAHNCVPFWQLGIKPLENLLRNDIKNKYVLIIKNKETFFDSAYKANSNYLKIDIAEIFTPNLIECLVKQFLNFHIDIRPRELSIQSNKSKMM